MCKSDSIIDVYTSVSSLIIVYPLKLDGFILMSDTKFKRLLGRLFGLDDRDHACSRNIAKVIVREEVILRSDTNVEN